MKKPISRILVECSKTHDLDRHTGIERAVRNLVRWSMIEGESLGVQCQPIALKYGRFVHVDAEFEQTEVGKPRELSAAERKAQYEKQERVAFKEGDLLLLLEISNYLPIWPAVLRAKSKGAVVASLIHDVIPVSHPQYFSDQMVASFKGWVQGMVTHSDIIICSSKFTYGEVKRYAAQIGVPESSLRMSSFELSADLDGDESAGLPRQHLVDVFGGAGNTYLVVATIEPRKNHALLLDAFDIMWKQGLDAKLCIVGRVGWHIDELMERIRTHPFLGTRLFMYHDVSDSELVYCYRNARALLAASHIEGFGLPNVEALRRGLHVMASDTPIHRETGGPFCTYFDPNDPADLVRIITKVEAGGSLPDVRDPSERHWTTWRESCRQLLEKSLSLCSTAVAR